MYAGLLDHLLKHLADQVVGPEGERLRRRHDREGHMVYWIQSPSDAVQGGCSAGLVWVKTGGARDALQRRGLGSRGQLSAELLAPSCSLTPSPPPTCLLCPVCLPAEQELLKEEAGALSAELLEVKEARRVLHAVRGEAAQAIQAVRWGNGWESGSFGGRGGGRGETRRS